MNPFQINRDRSVDQDKVFLVDKLFHPIRNGEIHPVSDLQIVANLNSNWECRFTVYRETDGVPCPLWDQITDLALVKIENKGIFELEAPITDEAGTYKQCSGKSICEAETSQTLMTLEINTDDDIARESETDPLATYYKELPTVFYRDLKDFSVFQHISDDHDAKILQSLNGDEKREILRRSSLLHRVFSEMPEYLENIDGENIDDSLKNLKHTFSWSDTSVYDICQDIAEEIQCIFIFDKFSRSFQVRDLKDHCEIDHCRDIQDGICPVCKQNGTTQKITSFGKYSGVEIDTSNLAETITLSGNKDSVKNYFKVEGADDIITDRISNRLIGNGYIWKTGALQRSQMSPELVAALEDREQMMTADYDAGSEYQNIQDKYNKLWDQWNALESQKLEYQSGMMPSPEMADQKAEDVFNYLFGANGKITYACASNCYQTDTQIADSVMKYAKLLISTGHTIEYTDLKCDTDEDVVTSISFCPHIYLDEHYREDEDGKKVLVDEYPASGKSAEEVTLEVAKGYDVTVTDSEGEKIYSTDYYNYLKRLIDTANAKSGITDEVITFDPITHADISPDAEFDNNGEQLKSTHYSKYCYNRLDSFCNAYEACSAVVAEINDKIPSGTNVLSGQKLNKNRKNYFVIPLKSDLSSYNFSKNVTYSLTIRTSSAHGFWSENFFTALGINENINPSSSNLLRLSNTKTDSHTITITFKGDGKSYSHLCIGLASKYDYDKNYNYVFSLSVLSDISLNPSTETVNTLKYLNPDGVIGENIQEDLLGKYKHYMVLLSERMKWLQEQIKEMEDSQASLMTRINEIKETCDMEHCLTKYANEHGISRNLWYELCSFRRQDTYRNDNFFGEGVDDAKLMENVENLLKRAEEEIESACNITYSASATISNLLTLPEFEPFWDQFILGNYIHMVIDHQIHTMRLISITYDYSDLSHCSVEFSDVIRKSKNKTEEIADILSHASSLASSAKTTARQAEQGAAAKLSVDVIKNDALNLANSKIITADDQNFVIDKYGITGKYTDPISGEVSGEQIRIINNLLCFTDDNWQHTRTALGKISYVNPETKEYETKYGLIADTIIGNLMLGEKLIISDGNGTTWIDGNGIKVISGYLYLENDKNKIEINPKNDSIFTITNKSANTEVINLTSDGNAHFTGAITAQSGKFTGNIILDGGCLTTNAERTTYNDNNLSGLTINKDGIGAYSSSNSMFTLTSTGELTATGANITGEICATKGYIGGTNGWTISNGAIYKGCNTLNSKHSGIYIGTDGIRMNGSYYDTKLQDGVINMIASSNNLCESIDSGGLVITGEQLDDSSNVISGFSSSMRSSFADFTNLSTRRCVVGYMHARENPENTETGLYLVGSDNFIHGSFCMKDNSVYSELFCDHVTSHDGMTLNIDRYITSNVPLPNSNALVSIIGKSSSSAIWIGHYQTEYKDQTKSIQLNADIINSIGTLFTPDGSISQSDIRLKTEITDIGENEVNFILGLHPKKYKLKEGTSRRYHFGLIAQDVEDLMQDTIGDNGLLVKREQYVQDDERYVPIDFQNNATFYYGLRYEEFISPMIKTIQKLNEEIQQLKEQIRR